MPNRKTRCVRCDFLTEVGGNAQRAQHERGFGSANNVFLFGSGCDDTKCKLHSGPFRAVLLAKKLFVVL